jgi:aromatic ring-cleaving dioxygenase
MTLTEFIKENKQEIDACIKKVVRNCKLDNQERRLWILNDEGLYTWAKSEGVKNI